MRWMGQALPRSPSASRPLPLWREGSFRRHHRNLLFLRLGRDFGAVGQHLLVAALGRAFVSRRLDLHQHRADRDLVADLACQFGDRARDRAFHFDRRLVGHHVGQLLILADDIANLDVPGDDFGLGNAFADVGELELVGSHYDSMTFLRAFFIRIGPGK